MRASVVRATSASLDDLAAALPSPVVSLAVRDWPDDFPDDVAVQRRVPYESRADSVMYCQVLSECAHVRGWEVHLYGAKDVEAQRGTGVEYVRYWLDSKAGKVFCLAKGPNKEAVAAVHQKAGHPANELYEVNEGQ